MTTAAARIAAAAFALFGATGAQAGAEEGRAKSQLCAACHGADGNAVVAGTPSLAGQPRQFLVQALFMYREGTRKNAVMTPLAQSLSNADLNDLAAWFGSQKMAPPKATMDAARADKARAITEQNNCVACHAANLGGQQHIPRIAGQDRVYLLDQLKGFKASTRADLDGTMTSAAQALAADDLELIADYLASRVLP